MSDTAEPQVNPQRDSAVSVRLCTEVDLAVILEIEQVCYSTPWNRPAFVHELHNPHGRFLVAEQTRPVHYVKPSGEIVKKAAKKIVGYLCSWRKYYENREDGLLMVCSLKNKDKHRKQ